MIVSLMAFLFVVSVVACIAAALVETGLRSMGAPTRFAWMGALAMGPLLLAVGGLGRLRAGAPPAPPEWAPVIEMPALLVASGGGGSGGFGVEELAALAWAVAGLGLLALVARTHRVLLRERTGWESTQVLGRDVYVSADRGPAVAGVWNPWIVLPRWVLALPERELRMVLLHEEEHLRARDTHLLGAALAVVALSAWNPLTWWQFRRMRAAMEVDCDRRVLREVPDRATYGASLLSVAARSSGPSLGLAAFTERSLNLKRRILTMTAKTSRRTALGGGVLVVMGLVVGVQACGVETPVGLGPTAGIMAVEVPAPASTPAVTGTTPEGGGVFTPFTVAPSIMNRDEIVEAMWHQYPPLLREAGVGGTALVFMYIDTTGAVRDTRVQQSSGHPALDDAALRVAGIYRFDPARNRDKKVEVWVSFPLTFQVGEVDQTGAIRIGPSESPASAPPPSVEAGPSFTPFTVAPSILNRDEVIAAMVREYPPLLREAGVGGTVKVYFLIGDDGMVRDVRMDRSSGEEAIDEAALRVAQVYRFSPALNKAEKVPVWVSFPITFQARR